MKSQSKRSVWRMVVCCLMHTSVRGKSASVVSSVIRVVIFLLTWPRATEEEPRGASAFRRGSTVGSVNLPFKGVPSAAGYSMTLP